MPYNETSVFHGYQIHDWREYFEHRRQRMLAFLDLALEPGLLLMTSA